MTTIPVLLITGPPGAGKTALAKEIGEQLFHAAVAHAVIDLDELARIRPAEPDERVWTDLVANNLRAIWPNYRDLRIDRLVLAGLVTSPKTIDTYARAIPDADVTICRVRAPLDTLGARLRHREPGTVRSFLLDAAPRLDHHLASQALEDITIDIRTASNVDTGIADAIDTRSAVTGPTAGRPRPPLRRRKCRPTPMRGALAGVELSPMLACAAPAAPVRHTWVFEPKMDGFRTLLSVDAGGRVRMISRRGHRWERRPRSSRSTCSRAPR